MKTWHLSPDIAISSNILEFLTEESSTDSLIAVAFEDNVMTMMMTIEEELKEEIN